MRYFRYALLLSLIFGLATVLSAQDAENSSSYSEFVLLREDLKRAQNLVKKLPQSQTKSKLQSTLGRAQRRCVRLGKREQSRSSEMSEKRHRQLLKKLKKKSFACDRLVLLKLALSRKSNLSCRQGKAIIKCFTFDSDQCKAVLLLYPHLTDLENVDEFLSGLTFSITRDNMRKKLGIAD